MARRVNKRRVRRYESCPDCDRWSIRVEENGRICRHSVGFGYVERFPPGHPFTPTPVCIGSGKKVLPGLLPSIG